MENHVPVTVEQAVPDGDHPVDHGRAEDERVVAGDDGRLSLVLEPGDDLHEFQGELAVQVGRRFIGDDDRGIVHQRPGDRHPLGLSAGEPFHLRGGALPEAEHLQEGKRPLPDDRRAFLPGDRTAA